MGDIYTRLLLLVMVISLVSGCQEKRTAAPVPASAEYPSSLPFTMTTDRPMDLEEAIAGRVLATIYFVGTMGCSNHDPMHIATTFEEMKKLSDAPTNCRGWKFVGAMIIGVPTILISMGIAALIPVEEIPRFERLPNGGMAYYFVSLGESIMPPVVAILFVIFFTLATWIVPHDKNIQSPGKSALSGPYKWIASFGRGLAICIVIAGFIGILWLLFLVIVLKP